VVTSVRGGGVAIVTSLSEVLNKKYIHMTVPFKRGDVTVVVDMLIKLANETDIQNPKPVGTVEYVKNNTRKMLSRTKAVSDLILPSYLQSIDRNQVLTHEVLGYDRQVNGMDAIRLQLKKIVLLRERESEIFNSLES
jgi:hypothetical protein